MNSEFELKVLSLIGSLQNEINTLKKEVASIQDQIQKIQPRTEPESERLSINDVREYIKHQLLLLFPHLQFTNGSRSKGKLTISNGRTTIERILIRTSKSFRKKDGYPSGWITIHKDILKQYDLYFFVVKDFNGELHVLTMKKTDIEDWVRYKKIDSSGNYHFYINLIHGKWIDDREGNYDCSRFYKNWEVVSDLLSDIERSTQDKNFNKKGMEVMNQVNLLNHRKPWSDEDDSKIAEIAKNIQTREELERIAIEKAPEFGRTHVAVAKRIENHKGWHYRQEGD